MSVISPLVNYKVSLAEILLPDLFSRDHHGYISTSPRLLQDRSTRFCESISIGSMDSVGRSCTSSAMFWLKSQCYGFVIVLSDEATCFVIIYLIRDKYIPTNMTNMPTIREVLIGSACVLNAPI